MKKLKYLILKLAAWRKLLKKDRKRQFKIPLGKQIDCWRNGFLPESYVIYDFEKNDIHSYLSDFRRTVKTSGINGKASILLDEKYVFCTLFKDNAKVLQPIAFVRNNKIFSWGDHRLIEPSSLPDFLNHGDFVVKPSGGGGGFGVFFLSSNEDLKLDDRPSDWSMVQKRILSTPGALIYKRVVQTGFAQKINPRSLNTIRLLTMIDPLKNEPFVGHAVFRCGTRKSGNVDNWSNGGLSAKVDITTGVICEAATFPYDGKLEWFAAHPDSGHAIKGVRIPQWDQIVKEVLELAKALYYLPYIGWDIIPMEEGFLILEANSNSDVNLLQVHEPLLTNPRVQQFYKFYGVL